MTILSFDDQQTLHHRYKHNDLYRQWLPILSMLQRDYDEADAQTLWYMAERQIDRLRGESEFREQEIQPIYNGLLSECSAFNGITRSRNQAKQTASTVMCIMLTMLMNAVEKGHEDEDFENQPMCLAILDILSGDAFFQNLMKLFFKRNIGYDGQKVVITPSDPMQARTDCESMDEFAKKEARQMVQAVMKHTQGLKVLFDKKWELWEQLWTSICADTELMLLMKEKNPRTTDWGLNQKMVCNVVGMFSAKIKPTKSVKAINDVLCTKNVRSYISNHNDYKGNDSAFTHETHDRVMRLIEGLLSNKE